MAILLSSCADYQIEEDYPPKWVVASHSLPREKLQGLQQAGFFEIGDSYTLIIVTNMETY